MSLVWVLGILGKQYPQGSGSGKCQLFQNLVFPWSVLLESDKAAVEGRTPRCNYGGQHLTGILQKLVTAAAGAGPGGSPASSPPNTCFHSLFLPSKNQKSAKHLVLAVAKQNIQCFLPEVILQFKMYSIFISNYLNGSNKIVHLKGNVFWRWWFWVPLSWLLDHLVDLLEIAASFFQVNSCFEGTNIFQRNTVCF